MKKFFLCMTTLCFFALTLSSCSMSYIGGIQPSKHRISRSYNNIKDFSSIYSDVVANLEYTQSDVVSVVIEGPDNYVPLFVVSEDNGTLKITMKKNSKLAKGNSVTIRLSSPIFRKLQNEGVGNIKLLGKIQGDAIEIRNDAVGNVKVENLICNTLDVNSDGVGNLNLSGVCNKATYSVDGVGNLNAVGMKTVNLDIDQDGVGNISCFASKRLSVKSEGVGNVKYAGNPEQKQINREGVGSVKSID